MKTMHSVLLAAGLLAASLTQAAAADAIKIGLLMPCTQCSDRWEQKDRPSSLPRSRSSIRRSRSSQPTHRAIRTS